MPHSCLGSLIRKIIPALFLFGFHVCFSQTYITNGSATKNSCNCYTLTTESPTFQSGSVWNKNKMDLQQPFDFKFNVFLGCRDFDGADGIAFILQTQPTSVGRSGSGLGFAGVSPSIGIALDTWQNIDPTTPDNDLNDPPYDHISIQANGVVRHGHDLAEPVQASANSYNIEDCQWHVLRITWDPATKRIEAYFDGVFRVGATVDLINTIFGSTAPVYWGFSAATGGAVNIQKFCTALNPDFGTDPPNNGTCIGSPISFTDQSISFAPITNYYWTFGDGTSSTLANPGSHLYNSPGEYPVRLAITGLDGCQSDTLQKKIIVGSIPDAAFTVSDACFKKAPPVIFQNSNIGTSYQWLLDGTLISTDERPQLPAAAAGTHSLQRKVISDFGCGTANATQPLTIKPAPVLQVATRLGVCANAPNVYNAAQQDNQTTVQQWDWAFGDGQQSTLQNPTHVYKNDGDYTAHVWATATNGCTSDTGAVAVEVVQAHANAGVDTIVLRSVPFHLAGSGDGTPLWSPTTGLERTDVFDPAAALTDDQLYELTVTTPEGCVAKDSVKVDVFKGSAVYVPTAFTPNGNGLNDELKPMYKAIRTLYYFSIYNRWGQLVFSTTNLSEGWDGKQNGKDLSTGTFVWMLRAEDVVGHVYQLKGTFVLIR